MRKTRMKHYWGTNPSDPLSRDGGFEIAMMAGAYLEARSPGRLIVLVDGFISTAAV